MASEYQDIVKQGYVKMKSKKLGMWQKKWVILRRASSKGANRLERYADEKASHLSYEAKTIYLSNVYRVERVATEGKNHVICLWFEQGDYKQMACSSDMDASDWEQAMANHVGTSVQSNSSSLSLSSSNRGPNTDMFHVYLLPNSNTDYSGEYLLHVTSEAIVLRNTTSLEVILTWKLNTLRRYGRDDTKFTFESGRQSETGEGLFIFTSVDVERIYQKVHTATLALVTVKNISRHASMGRDPLRQPVEGSEFSVDMSITRQASDSEAVVRPSNGDAHLPARDTKSLPVSPSRGPLPLPRKPVAGADANANTEYLYTQANEQRSPKLNFGDDYSTRPLPPAPNVSTSYNNGEADDVEYIYEEKGLSDNFKRFLAERKEDDLI